MQDVLETASTELNSFFLRLINTIDFGRRIMEKTELNIYFGLVYAKSGGMVEKWLAARIESES